MSALGQKQTSEVARATSALHPKVDIHRHNPQSLALDG
jgi:hypothetical protein